MEHLVRYEVEDLIREAGGLRATHRKSGVAMETLRTGRRGMRDWSPETRAKLARAWGVGVGEVRWPTREAAPQVPPRRETPRIDLSALYEDKEFKAAVEREVQRRMADAQAAAQEQDA